METVCHKKPLDFAKGMPKICVPITESSLEEALAALNTAQKEPADLLEWRLDYFPGDVIPALKALAQSARLPLLCTLRTAQEGGNAAVTKQEYIETLTVLIKSGLCDYVDIELSLGEAPVQELVKLAEQYGTGTVLSMHDFEKTPGREVLISTFLRMHALGAVLPKIAVMPNTPEDVLLLLEAALHASREIGPLAAISMGQLGKISRVAGGSYGSRLTFSSGKSGSAPGQLSTESLYSLMHALADSKAEGDEGK